MSSTNNSFQPCMQKKHQIDLVIRGETGGGSPTGPSLCMTLILPILCGGFGNDNRVLHFLWQLRMGIPHRLHTFLSTTLFPYFSLPSHSSLGAAQKHYWGWVDDFQFRLNLCTTPLPIPIMIFECSLSSRISFINISIYILKQIFCN